MRVSAADIDCAIGAYVRAFSRMEGTLASLVSELGDPSVDWAPGVVGQTAGGLIARAEKAAKSAGLGDGAWTDLLGRLRDSADFRNIVIHGWWGAPSSRDVEGWWIGVRARGGSPRVRVVTRNELSARATQAEASVKRCFDFS